MQVEQLKKDHWYEFHHLRKGVFYAKFVELVDYIGTRTYVKVAIWTQDGSGQERLANTYEIHGTGLKQRPLFEGRLLLPSLLTDIKIPSDEQLQRLKTLGPTPEAILTKEPIPILAKPVPTLQEQLLQQISQATPSTPVVVQEPEDAPADPEKKPGFFGRLFRRK